MKYLLIDDAEARMARCRSEELRDACYRLRHDYFVATRGWIGADSDRPGLETDQYDAHCDHLAVVQSYEVRAYLRVLPYRPETGFMLDREFAALLDEQQRDALHHAGSVELTRLVCGPGAGTDASGTHSLEHLLRLLYGLSLERGYWRFTIVVEAAWLRPFTRKFRLPFRVIGGPVAFPDGTSTVAATATLTELENAMRRHSAAKYEWYRSILGNDAVCSG